MGDDLAHYMEAVSRLREENRVLREALEMIAREAVRTPWGTAARALARVEEEDE